ALRHVLSGGEAEDRRFRLRGIVADGEQFEGSERTNDEVDVVALDELLGLRLGPSGVATSVADDELGLAASEPVVPVLEKAGHPLFHRVAALRERPVLHGQRAEGAGLALRERGNGERRRRRRRGGQEFAPVEFRRHWWLLSPYPRRAASRVAVSSVMRPPTGT